MRRLDWPERLAETIAAARHREFSDENYCASFAADCVNAITGTDPMSDFRGLSMEDALEKLKDSGYRSVYFFLTKQFGRPRPLALAQRGDVVVRTKPDLAIGICCGQYTAFTTETGLTYLPTIDQRWSFRVS